MEGMEWKNAHGDGFGLDSTHSQTMAWARDISHLSGVGDPLKLAVPVVLGLQERPAIRLTCLELNLRREAHEDKQEKERKGKEASVVRIESRHRGVSLRSAQPRTRFWLPSPPNPRPRVSFHRTHAFASDEHAWRGVVRSSNGPHELPI